MKIGHDKHSRQTIDTFIVDMFAVFYATLDNHGNQQALCLCPLVPMQR